MTKEETLTRAIEAADISAVRIAIRAIADDDRYRATPLAGLRADAAEAVLQRKGLSIWQQDDGCLSIPEESEWSESVLHSIKGSLDWNFSRERIQKLDAVNKWLYKTTHRSDEPRPFVEPRADVKQSFVPREVATCRRRPRKNLLPSALVLLVILLIAILTLMAM